MRRLILTVVVAIISGLPCVSQADGRVLVENLWARAITGSTNNGAVFMTIIDTSGLGDTLISVKSPIAAIAEIHEHRLVGGIMQMRAVASISIPAKGSVTMQPGAEHVMLMGLKRPLQEGEMIPIFLTFTGTGTIKIMAQVRGIGAMGPIDTE